jgi:hypothetical protein
MQAMWLQLAMDVSADKIVRQCANCKKWMIAAPGTRSFRRTTCSDSCRSLKYQRSHLKVAPSRLLQKDTA